jgi:AbrB family looped-hinge helix DNA binding protein
LLEQNHVRFRVRGGFAGNVHQTHSHLAKTSKAPRHDSVVDYRGNMAIMSIARSRLTSQGQVSVPAEVRRRLGLATGSVLEWDEDDGQIVVRRGGQYTSADIHRTLFSKGSPKPRTLEELKDGIRQYIRKKHARH